MLHTVGNEEPSQMADETSGRKAQTRGVSLSPREAALVDEFAALSGIGLTEQVRHNVIRRLPAAVALLRDMREAGMELDVPADLEQVVYAEGAGERRALYEDSFDAEEAQQPAGKGA